MSSRKGELLDEAILRELESLKQSPSHDRWHTDRVLSFAKQLHKLYDGDLEVIVAAARLHDLGRADPSKHGEESTKESVARSKPILESVGMAAEKTSVVLEAIADHDKPSATPRSLEGRILKDADFLAGFGSWGILRTCMWAGESRETTDTVLNRLERRMPDRLTGLEFPESRRLASREMLFVKLFLSNLKTDAVLEQRLHKGLYIGFDGISGSGKRTQINLLMPRLEGITRSLLVVKEPPNPYDNARQAWEKLCAEKPSFPEEQMFLLFTSRARFARERLWPALESGKIVLSDRSFISTLVYQKNDLYESEMIAFLHRFLPQFDLFFLFDVRAPVSYQRSLDRAGGNVELLSEHENLESMTVHRERFLDSAKAILPERVLRIVPSEERQEDIAARIWAEVESLLSTLK